MKEPTSEVNATTITTPQEPTTRETTSPFTSEEATTAPESSTASNR